MSSNIDGSAGKQGASNFLIDSSYFLFSNLIVQPVQLIGSVTVAPLINEVFVDNALASLVTIKSADNLQEYKNVLTKKSSAYMAQHQHDEKLLPFFCTWFHEAASAWIKVIGRKAVARIISDGVGETEAIPKVISQLVQEIRGDFNFTACNDHYDPFCSHVKLSLLNLVNVNSNLEENSFLFWHVDYRFKQCQVKDNIAEIGFPKFTDLHTSAMAEILKKSEELYEFYDGKRTKFGFTFDDVIKPGLLLPSSAHGCCIGDDETLETFTTFFSCVISYLDLIDPDLNVADDDGNWMGQCGKIDLDASLLNTSALPTKYLVTSYILANRNISGLPFPVHATRAERAEAEQIIVSALSVMPSATCGERTSLLSIGEGGRSLLVKHGVDTNKPSPSSYLASCGGSADWPHNRSVYCVDNSQVLWVNKEDHLKVDLKDPTGDLGALLGRYSKLMSAIEANLNALGHQFACCQQFGYHTVNPANLGCGMSVGGFIKAPFLVQNEGMLREACKSMGLSYSIIELNKNLIIDITPKYSFGFSEVELIQILHDGLKVLIEIERCFETRDLNFVQCKEQLQKLLAALPTDFDSSKYDLSTAPFTRGHVKTFGKVARKWSVPAYDQSHSSLVAANLSQDLFRSMVAKWPETLSTFSLSDAVKVSYEIPDAKVGIYLSGAEAYKACGPLLVPLLKELHGFNCMKDTHVTSFSICDIIGADMVDQDYLDCFSISCLRNIAGMPMLPAIDRKSRRIVESIISTILGTINNNSGIKLMKGQYERLANMSSDKIVALRRESDVCFVKPALGSEADVAGYGRDWPDARGVFCSSDKNLLVLVNQEEHVKVVLSSRGSGVHVLNTIKDWDATMRLLDDMLALVGHSMCHSSRLGFLTSSLNELGTGLKVEATLRLPLLTQLPEMLEEICRDEDIICTIANESRGTWKLTNKLYLGFTESKIFQTVIDCMLTLVKVEKDIEVYGIESYVVKLSGKNAMPALVSAFALSVQPQATPAAKVGSPAPPTVVTTVEVSADEKLLAAQLAQDVHHGRMENDNIYVMVKKRQSIIELADSFKKKEDEKVAARSNLEGIIRRKSVKLTASLEKQALREASEREQAERERAERERAERSPTKSIGRLMKKAAMVVTNTASADSEDGNGSAIDGSGGQCEKFLLKKKETVASKPVAQDEGDDEEVVRNYKSPTKIFEETTAKYKQNLTEVLLPLVTSRDSDADSPNASLRKGGSGEDGAEQVEEEVARQYTPAAKELLGETSIVAKGLKTSLKEAATKARKRLSETSSTVSQEIELRRKGIDRVVSVTNEVIAASKVAFSAPLSADVEEDFLQITNEMDLEALERIYKKRFPRIQFGVNKVVRDLAPPGSFELIVKTVGCSTSSPFEGVMADKKMFTERNYIKRFVWIDHLSHSLHWAKKSSKAEEHKAIDFYFIKTIRPTKDPPRKFKDEVFFTIDLKNGKSIEIALDMSISKEAKVDWMKSMVYFMNKNKVLA